MNRNCFKISALALVLVLLSTCTNPIDDINQFKMGFNGGALINPVVNLSFGIKDEQGAVPEDVIVSIDCEDPSLITDANGEYMFEVNQDGSLPLLLNQNVNPTESNPLMIKVMAEAKNCMPIMEEIYITNKREIPNIQFLFYRNTNLPAGFKMQEYQAIFSGKKATDTLVFNHQNLKGDNFTFKYPVNGAKFVAKKQIKYIENIQERKVIVDASWDTTWKELEEQDSIGIVGATHFYEGQPLNGKPVTFKVIREVTKGRRRIPVVYRTLTDTFYSYKYIPDTIGVENLRLQIFSSSRGELETSGFYDEAGNYVSKPRLFTDVLNIPETYFTTNDGRPVEVIYPLGIRRGRIVEADVQDKSLSFYQAGYSMVYDKTKNEFQYVYLPVIIPSNRLPLKDGKFVFTDDLMFNKRFFLFKSYTVGCGFSNIKINTDYDLESFWAGWEVEHGDLRYYNLYPTWYTNIYGTWRGYDVPKVHLKLPAFNEFGKAKVKFVVDHDYNRCLPKPILYQKIEEYDPCAIQEYEFNANYNPGAFWAEYINVFCKINVDAKVTCKSGNLVEVPRQRVNYYRMGCDPSFKTETELEDGKTTLTLVDQSSYMIAVANPYNSGIIRDTLVLNQKSQDLEGFVTDKAGQPLFRAFLGTLKYDYNTRSYKLDLVFENYFKYNIPGCN